MKKVKRILNKEDSDNPYKVKKEREKRLLSNLNNPVIRNLLSFEIPIDLVLDNATIHSSELSMAVFKILNINPIFLPIRSPDLNPIEDLWGMIKDRIYKTYYTSLDELITIFEKAFEEFVVRESLYENWIKDMV
ncbi:transposase [Methanobrevibacter sp.]|uniref:transposase n=1 Tax=Methanobrevibacter sp. TaxID=66852 RepID=UPI00388DEEE7